MLAALCVAAGVSGQQPFKIKETKMTLERKGMCYRVLPCAVPPPPAEAHGDLMWAFPTVGAMIQLPHPHSQLTLPAPLLSLSAWPIACSVPRRIAVPPLHPF